MTVKDLRDQLSKLPDDWSVVVSAISDDGYLIHDDIATVVVGIREDNAVGYVVDFRATPSAQADTVCLVGKEMTDD